MKKTIIYCAFVMVAFAGQMTLTSCEDIEEVPPMKDSSTGKSYKIPDPVVMDAADNAAYESIKDEYNKSTTISD